MGSLSAPDRFLQSIRLTIARYEHYDNSLQGILTVPMDTSTRPEEEADTVSGHIILGIHRNGETIRVAPVLGPDGQRLASLIQTSVASGELYYTTELHAFGMVTVRNDRVTGCVPPKSILVRSDAIAGFWNDLCRCLTRYRDAPVAWLHLLLGEASFRFHHQGEFLSSVIEKWVKKTPFFELKKQVDESFPSVVE